MKKSASG